MAITKAVITAAGLGTRLLPATKEIPKEMVPVYARGASGSLVLKPILQIIFENLFDAGVREFCFVVGRGKRAIEDHFTPDYGFVEYLRGKGKLAAARELEEFYGRVEGSTIVWVNQPEPRGFGDAVLRARPFVGAEPFIVHAGDTLVYPPSRGSYVSALAEVFEGRGGAGALLVKEVERPELYGVVVPGPRSGRALLVSRIVEKPREPPSRLAVVPVYAFDPLIFKALERLRPSERGEVELTSAIQSVIDWGFEVWALPLSPSQTWLDVGTPETYWAALERSRALSSGERE
ncbi:MAG: hypothetical protein DRJ56_06360 [Thermoprotei archaeon]|nr:MAG: hypothetical protein DRJ56_06360 [Thermoprotei archaeon]